MSGRVSYLEIGAGKAQASRQFFGDLFGWAFQSTQQPGEGWFGNHEMRIGLHGGDPTPGILVFFEVSDMATARARVVELGGTADMPSPDEPGFGIFCLCTGPEGIRFGLHQSSTERGDRS
ncbi:VOC family protein [Cupriavidus basilensis]|uniref:VOC family protein n=1 Tax=Cupriavidus basilensis TaxID=68895 RepID=A0ABT6AQR1_9BURK|nr:VOC family protein [Cupriavidus basilensis]MDF3834925.1 VOC family protein [Cupriavidus basilensis]